MKIKNIFKSRRFKHGSMATAMTVLFVVAVVIVNAIASMVLDRLPVSVDLTDDKIYQLTDESESFAKEIKMPVTITICADEATLPNLTAQGQPYGKQAQEIISGYAKANNNVTIKYVDLVKEPGVATKYSEYGVTTYSIIVESEKRTKVVSLNDFIETQTNQQTQTQSFLSSAEKVMTSALMYVTDDEVLQVSVLSGHTEVGAVGLTSMLKDNNYEITEQNITTEEINPDAKMAVIYAPTTDYSDEELKKLDKFLDNDAKYDKTLIYIADYNQPELPNLALFLKEWGIEIGSGVIGETDEKNIYYTSPYIFKADYVDDTYTKDLRQADLPFLTSSSRPVSTLWEESGNRSAKLILTSPETSVLVPVSAGEGQTEFDVDKAKKQAYGIAALGQRTKYEGTDPHISSVVAFGGASMFGPKLTSDSTLNNNEFSINVINKLAGKEEALNIVSVSFDAQKLENVTLAKYNAVKWIFVVIIPLVTLICGIVIWVRRRNK